MLRLPRLKNYISEAVFIAYISKKSFGNSCSIPIPLPSATHCSCLSAKPKKNGQLGAGIVQFR